ncbi:MAG TPA: sensor domain-containing protein [Streptosporangiaceae bacterium]|nr:sensor domain-containing protein [Streptosporangiaceae bacterium]
MTTQVNGAGPPPPAGGSGGGTRLVLYRNPLRLVVSASLWRGVWYLAGYVFVTGWILFAVALTATVTAAVFAVTLAGIPLLAAAAGVVRGCANVERGRLHWVLTQPVRGRYLPVTRPGIIAQATTRWRDRATWRDVAYLIGLWAPLFILDTIVFAIWLTFLAGITLPAWYWAPENTFDNGLRAHGAQLGYFPNGPHGPGGHGLYVDTLPKALLAAAVFLVLFLLFSYVLVITARAHARIARAVLRAPADPLAEAKEVLTHPGPLGPLNAGVPDMR